mgnify:CR=1 FL=1
MRLFKFFNKDTRVPLPIRFNFEYLDVIERNTYLQGYYDALDHYSHGTELDIPFHPLTDETEYSLWAEGVRRYEETNNISWDNLNFLGDMLTMASSYQSQEECMEEP